MKKLIFLIPTTFALVLSGCGGGGNSAMDDNMHTPDAGGHHAFEDTRFLDIHLRNLEVLDAFNGNSIRDAATRGWLAKSSGNLADRIEVTPNGVILNGDGTRANGSLVLNKRGAAPWTIDSRNLLSYFEIDIDDNATYNYDDEGNITSIASSDMTLVQRIYNNRTRTNQFAQAILHNYYQDEDNWIAGGIWNTLEGDGDSINAYIRARKGLQDNNQTPDGAALPACPEPCVVERVEFGIFVDGAPWRTADGGVPTLPANGSATYANDHHILELNFVNPEDERDERLLGLLSSLFDSSDVNFNVNFAGDSTSMSGTIVDARPGRIHFQLADTPWNPNVDDSGGFFYGENTLSCAGANPVLLGAICGNTYSEFAAEFFGRNGEDGQPNLMGGIYNITGISPNVYFDENGDPTIDPSVGGPPTQYDGTVSGAFQAFKQPQQPQQP